MKAGSKNRLRESVSNETFASTLSVNLLETFTFCPLVDHAEGCEEESYDNGHEAVYSRKRVIQCVVRKCCNGVDTKASRRSIVVGDHDESWVSAKTPSYFSGIICIKIPTTLELILEDDAICHAQLDKQRMEIIAFAKGEEPDPGTDKRDDYGIDNECPVENHQAQSNMIGLDYGTNRDYNSGEEEDSQSQSGSQRHWAKDHVHQNIGSTPRNR